MTHMPAFLPASRRAKKKRRKKKREKKEKRFFIVLGELVLRVSGHPLEPMRQDISRRKKKRKGRKKEMGEGQRRTSPIAWAGSPVHAFFSPPPTIRKRKRRNC